jgi:class 3 adenylate cyclase/regulator of replication initiation timing
MEKRIFKPSGNKPINPQLDNLEQVQQKVAEIINEKAAAIKEIREGFVECVVVFIDLVDSTKFKIENSTEPEKWILRVKHFGDIIKEYIENSNGKVVKYIGDEVMGIFDAKTKIDDAISVIQRIKNIEANLTEITGADTKVKIALDFGSVFLIKYDGHDELDPQGTPIDRCARIGKYCEPGTVLSSYEFVSNCAFPKQWFKLGSVEMKGLGTQPIYQFGEQTIELKKKIEVLEDDLNFLKQSIEQLTEENQTLLLDKRELISTVEQLQTQIKEIGEKPVIETDFSEEEEEDQSQKDWDEIQENFRKLKKLIHDSGVPDSEYARFLFLYKKGLSEEYNVFKNKEFSSSIERGLVTESSSERYELDLDHKRNQKAIEVIDETERLMQAYENEYGSMDDDDLYDHSFSDADFWAEWIGINVS